MAEEYYKMLSVTVPATYAAIYHCVSPFIDPLKLESHFRGM